MSLSDLLGTLQQYTGGTNNGANAEHDFDHVAQTLPKTTWRAA